MEGALRRPQGIVKPLNGRSLGLWITTWQKWWVIWPQAPKWNCRQTINKHLLCYATDIFLVAVSLPWQIQSTCFSCFLSLLLHNWIHEGISCETPLMTLQKDITPPRRTLPIAKSKFFSSACPSLLLFSTEFLRLVNTLKSSIERRKNHSLLCLQGHGHENLLLHIPGGI